MSVSAEAANIVARHSRPPSALMRWGSAGDGASCQCWSEGVEDDKAEIGHRSTDRAVEDEASGLDAVGERGERQHNRAYAETKPTSDREPRPCS